MSLEKPAGAGEHTRLWRLPNLPNLELLRATYITQTFARHSHEGFAVGIIERGALGFFYRGENVIAPAGAINLANPDEAHTGHAAAETGWTYRMFYLDSSLLMSVASQIAGRSQNLPSFKKGVIHDAILSNLIRSLHLDMERDPTPMLHRESGLLQMLTQLILRHGEDRPPLRPTGHEHRSVRLVQDYLEAHYDEDVSLETLATMANLSPFHLLRVFGKEVGLPPHAYLTQLRIRRAKGLLSKGREIASVAYETGFVDQSHFTRQFKRLMGITPGQYRKIVQDRPA